MVALGARRTVSGLGCWWIPGAVPLSTRKNAKGGEQGTQLACGSNKCPVSGFRTQRAGGIAEQTVPGEESVDQARWNGVNIWYYFNTLTGAPQGSLVKNTTTPDGYKVGADGAWLQ